MSAPTSSPPPQTRLHFVLTNISKSGNIKTILTTCCCFGVTRVYVVGQPKFNPLKHIPLRIRSRCLIVNRLPPAPYLHDAAVEAAFSSFPPAPPSLALGADAPSGWLVLDFSYVSLSSLSKSLLDRSLRPFVLLPDGTRLAHRLLGVEIVPDDPATFLRRGEEEGPTRVGGASEEEAQEGGGVVVAVVVVVPPVLVVRPPRPCRSLDDPLVFDVPSFLLPSSSVVCPPSSVVSPSVDVVLLMVGNEGTGMNSKQLAACDSFAYINQYGRGMSSLNVAVALAVVLERAVNWTRDRVHDDSTTAPCETPNATPLLKSL